MAKGYGARYLRALRGGGRLPLCGGDDAPHGEVEQARQDEKGRERKGELAEQRVIEEEHRGAVQAP